MMAQPRATGNIAGIRARLRVLMQRNRSQTSDIDHLVLEATVISAVFSNRPSELAYACLNLHVEVVTQDPTHPGRTLSGWERDRVRVSRL